MNIISKTIKGKEYMYQKNYTILCNSEKQAKKLAEHLNKNNENAMGNFKLKDNEIWHDYKIDMYDNEPIYKLKSSKNKISIIRL